MTDAHDNLPAVEASLDVVRAMSCAALNGQLPGKSVYQPTDAVDRLAVPPLPGSPFRG